MGTIRLKGGIHLLLMLGLAVALTACGGSDNPSSSTPMIIKSLALNGAQVVPAITTASAGTGLVTVNADSGEVNISITTFGIGATGAHLYSGAVGANGASVADLTQSSPGTWTLVNGQLTQDQVTALKAASLYVGITSSLYPSGEIRGQVGRQVYYATLFGGQESPPTTSSATGTGVYVFDPETKTLSGTTTTVSGVVAHIHTGAVGVSAGVTLPFTGGPTTWTLAPVVLTDAQVTALVSGNFYANVHSTAFPGGEIRGQVFQSVKLANLAGAQETPPNSSTASGTGSLAFNPFTREVAGRIETAGITGIAAHAHMAANGTPGAVVIPMTQTAAASGIWTTASNATATDAVFLAFMQGGLYLNVHSSTYPGGEIRGQLIQGQ